MELDDLPILPQPVMGSSTPLALGEIRRGITHPVTRHVTDTAFRVGPVAPIDAWVAYTIALGGVVLPTTEQFLRQEVAAGRVFFYEIHMD